MKDKINAFEMWIFRHMFRISHLDKKTNVGVLEIAKVKQTLLRTIHERRLLDTLYKEGENKNY